MFRIRQVTDPSSPSARRDIAQAQALLRDRLPGMPEREIEELPERLRDPLSHRMRAVLFVADNLRGRMLGFALMSHAPDVGFCLLDAIVTPRSGAGGGIGGALYGRVREAAGALGGIGLFYECLPDDPSACSDPESAKQNAARLRFYERLGGRVILGTGYEAPITPGGLDMPHLVYDGAGRESPLRAEELRAAVRAILERKYAEMCSPEYIEGVVASMTEDPVRLREPRRALKPRRVFAPRVRGERLIALVVNDRHDIHHVRERGYVEAPARVRAILAGVEPTGLLWPTPPREFPESVIRRVHDGAFVDYLKHVCSSVPEGKSVYPYVFPIRNQTRPPKDHAYAAGYYCIDTFTPLNRNAFLAAKRAVDCSMTAAEAVLGGQRLAYALVRPPGHHAERKSFGGFCYFCNPAIAAERLAEHGRVAILDIDYHHGNGQQDIFYERGDVLTVSVHAHPDFAYPFFTGFEDERGSGAGAGININICLPEKVDGAGYSAALARAVGHVRAFDPAYLVVALGLDTGRGDPTGTWTLRPADFERNGRAIGAIGLPTLVVQEGGYRTASLGANARAFFTGLVAGAFGPE